MATPQFDIKKQLEQLSTAQSNIEKQLERAQERLNALSLIKKDQAITTLNELNLALKREENATHFEKCLEYRVYLSSLGHQKNIWDFCPEDPDDAEDWYRIRSEPTFAYGR